MDTLRLQVTKYLSKYSCFEGAKTVDEERRGDTDEYAPSRLHWAYILRSRFRETWVNNDLMRTRLSFAYTTEDELNTEAREKGKPFYMQMPPTSFRL